jgi:N4-gp56 family major capsid protein
MPGSNLISQYALADKSIHTFIKFAQLAAGGTLTDGEEVTSEAVVDSEVQLTLLEKGNVVTTTNLGSVVTAGRLNTAVVELAGKNMGTTIDKFAITTLEASTNEVTINAGGEAATVATDIITPALVQRMYNKLRRSSIQTLAGGTYVAIAHPDVMYDLKAATAANSWTQVQQYTDAVAVFRNEVGMYGGFRWIESANVTINIDVGAAAVDTYHTIFCGYNALGLAMSSSVPLQLTMVDGTDKLNRFVHLGWKGILAYGIIDANAAWLLTGASTVGANV